MHEIITSHEVAIKYILEKSGDSLAKVEVQQSLYYLGNIKDWYEIKQIKHELEGPL